MRETRMLPNELTLENNVLAYIMNNVDGLFIAQRENIIADDFYDSTNVMIFNEMIKLSEDNINPSMQVLSTRVKSVEPTAIMNIAIEGTLMYENDFCDYIKLLKEYNMKRQMIYTTRDIESLYNKGVDVFDVVSKVSSTIENIGKISTSYGVDGTSMLNKAMDLVQYK